MVSYKGVRTTLNKVLIELRKKPIEADLFTSFFGRNLPGILVYYLHYLSFN